MAKYLLSLGATTDETNRDSLFKAFMHGWKKTVQYFLKMGFDINPTKESCLNSMQLCRLKTFQSFVAFGGDITANNDYLLRNISKTRKLDVIKYLVSLGANVTSNHNEAVINASENNRMDTVKYLVSLGADVTDQDNAAIVRACRNGHVELVKYLLNVGASF